MSNIRFTPEAEDDLVSIKKYITDELENHIAAINTVAKIMKRIRLLESFPELGMRLSSVINFATDYRLLVCGNYLAFYRIEENDVLIIRILHGRRDYMAVLFGELETGETEIDED